MVSPADRATERRAEARQGADPAAVGNWLAARLDDPAWTSCRLQPIGGGRSNLTYRVDSAAGTVVLRRVHPQFRAAVAAPGAREAVRARLEYPARCG